MTVRSTVDGSIVLEGTCSSEDAEELLQSLVEVPGASVDLRACEFAHTAVVQVLLAAKPKLLGPPLGGFLNAWIYPLLGGS